MKVSCIFAHFDFPVENPRAQNRNFSYTNTLAVIKNENEKNKLFDNSNEFVIMEL